MDVVRKLPHPWSEPRELGPRDFHIAQVPDAYTGSTLRLTPEGPWRDKLVHFAVNAEYNRVVGKSIALWGPYGRGKTSAAVAILKGMMSRGQSGLYVRYDKLMSTSRFRVLYDANYDDSLTLDEHAIDVDVLVIDDLFNGFDSDPERNTRCLQRILRSRHDRLGVTVVTTNVETKNWKKFMPATLETLLVNNWGIISMVDAPNERQRLSTQIYKRG